MVIIGKKIIVDFGRSQPQSRKALAAWEKTIKLTNYSSFNELKRTFPSADYVPSKYTIFNISGNKYRLVTEIDYQAYVVNIKQAWTHAEYSMRKNQEAIRRNTL